MTKSKKEKNAGAVAKLARKTIGLVVRVGDALEAVAVSVAPVPPTPSSSREPSLSTLPPSIPGPPAVAVPVAPVSAELSVPTRVEVPVVGAAVAEGAHDTRALEAIRAYAAQHNLQTVDLPGPSVLVPALVNGMVQHGPAFTDARIRFAIDEQMRLHLRTLSKRAALTEPASDREMVRR
jgi:hypothetical protein